MEFYKIGFYKNGVFMIGSLISWSDNNNIEILTYYSFLNKKKIIKFQRLLMIL